MKNRVLVIIIVLLCLIMIEEYAIRYNSSDEVVETVSSCVDVNDISINYILNDMKNKNCSISKITSRYDGYEVIIDIYGDVEEIRTKIKGLKDNTIKSYNLNVDDGVVSGNITIQY